MAKAFRNAVHLMTMAWLLFSLAASQAAVPFILNYQGFLTNPSTSAPLNTAGTPLPVTFKLWDALTAGNLIYSETQSVTVTNGAFNVQIGSGAAQNPPNVVFTAVAFDIPYWLEVTVDTGGTAQTLAPRQALASVPYALRAASMPAANISGTIATAQLAATQQLPAVACATSQIARWNGNAWACSADATGGAGTVQGQVSACTRTLIYIVGKGYTTYLPGSGTGTPASENFSFDRVPVGSYSLVVENPYGTQTVSVYVTDQEVATVPSIQFPCNIGGAGTVTVNFVVDDHINRVYQQGDLQWKGSFKTAADYATSHKILFDGNWAGPWPLLYDDGPWTQGGHEPIGATAGDHIWGVAVAVTPPATGIDTYQYGLIIASAPYSGAWIWPSGTTGSFTIASTQDIAVPVTAAGTAFAAFETTDVQLSLDTNNLAAADWLQAGVFDTSTVQVKTAHTAWVPQSLTNDGAGHYTFTLSSIAGAGKPFGLAFSGEQFEFLFVLGGMEYKNNFGYLGVGFSQGVSAGTATMGTASFVPANVIRDFGTGNTYIMVP
jgi:hypothetical protein